MVSRRQSGFTLVEIAIVMAISSLLLAGFLVGQSAVRNRNLQTGSIDTLKNQLEKIRNEAQSTVTNQGGGNSAVSVFGKLVEFDSSSGQDDHYTVSTLLGDDNDDTALLSACETQSVVYKDAMRFTGSGAGDKEAVVFTRDPDRIFHAPTNYSKTAGSINCSQLGFSQPPLNDGSSGGGGGGGGGGGPAGPQPCVSGADPAYVCGLYGKYFNGIGLNEGSKTLVSAFIDDTVGSSMGNGASAYSDFRPTLRYRTRNPASAVSVHWTGDIFIPDANPHQYCFYADDGSRVSINGQFIVNSYGSPDGPANPCATITLPADQVGWKPIDIQYEQMDASEGTPIARLFERTTTDTDVPNQYLRTSSSNQVQWPSKSFAQGLYGRYYSDANLGGSGGKYVSAYTDPLVGDGGIQFSYGSNTAFIPELRYNTATNDASYASVRWVGQILIDAAGSQTFRTVSDDGASVYIDGNLAVNDWPGGHPPTASTPGTVNLSAGWHTIEVDYRNNCCGGGSDNGAVVALQKLGSGGAYQEVPSNHLRRSLDWTANGSTGSCPSGATACGTSGSTISTRSSSSPQNCNSNNGTGALSFNASGLSPNTTFKMDLSYFNSPYNGAVSPPDYSYQVCVKANGSLVAGGAPASLPIWEPSTNPRTAPALNVTSDANGNIALQFNWINDSYCVLGILCSGGRSYDANFGISRIDLYRTISADGQLAWSHQNTSAQVSQGRLAATIGRWAGVGTAYAAACASTTGMDNNVLNPQNYATCGPFYDNPVDYRFTTDNVPGTPTITVDPSSNNITRSVQ